MGELLTAPELSAVMYMVAFKCDEIVKIQINPHYFQNAYQNKTTIGVIWQNPLGLYCKQWRVVFILYFVEDVGNAE